MTGQGRVVEFSKGETWGLSDMETRNEVYEKPQLQFPSGGILSARERLDREV